MLDFATEVAALKRAVQLRGEGGVLNHTDGPSLLQELDEALGQLEQRVRLPFSALPDCLHTQRERETRAHTDTHKNAYRGTYALIALRSDTLNTLKHTSRTPTHTNTHTHTHSLLWCIHRHTQPHQWHNSPCFHFLPFSLSLLLPHFLVRPNETASLSPSPQHTSPIPPLARKLSTHTHTTPARKRTQMHAPCLCRPPPLKRAAPPRPRFRRTNAQLPIAPQPSSALPRTQLERPDPTRP